MPSLQRWQNLDPGAALSSALHQSTDAAVGREQQLRSDIGFRAARHRAGKHGRVGVRARPIARILECRYRPRVHESADISARLPGELASNYDRG